MTFRLLQDNETESSHASTLSMAQHAAIEFAACTPLTDIPEACLDALSAIVTAELQQRTQREHLHGHDAILRQ